MTTYEQRKALAYAAIKHALYAYAERGYAVGWGTPARRVVMCRACELLVAQGVCAVYINDREVWVL